LKNRLPRTLAALALASAGCAAAKAAPAASPLAPVEAAVREVATEAAQVRRSLVTVDVNYQDWAWDEPWRKKSPGTRSGSALVLPGGQLLTTANVVAGATLVELRRGNEQTPWRGKVVLADPLANLALVAPEDAAFLEGLVPMEWADTVPTASEGAKVAVYRYRSGRRLDAIPGTVVELDATEPGSGLAQLLTLSAAVQMDGGGLGELVVRDGKVAGLVLSKWGEKLSILPTVVLRPWLVDAARGDARRGFAAAGWKWQSLSNPVLRAQLGVPKGREGVLLTKVWPYATGAGVLSDGDVLLSLGGKSIDARGNVEHPQFGPVRFGLLLSEGRLAGDDIDATIVHDKQVRSLRLKLAPDAPNRRLVPALLDGQPRYLVGAGLVFQELSLPWLRAFGDHAPLRLSVFNDLEGAFAGESRQRQVVLTQVLPDPTTVGYESQRGRLVSKVNGRAVQSLEQVAEALEAPQGGYVVVEFSDQPDRIVIDAKAAEAARERIIEAYQIAKDRNLASSW
jgi:S1-C subfamily serine protease